MTSNGNGSNGNKLIWWILGLSGSVFILSTSFLLNRLDTIGSRLTAIEIVNSSTAERLKQLDEIIRMTRTEQVDRTAKFAELSNRISILEINTKILDNRITGLNDTLVLTSKLKK